jgi:pimeloyl-ACP methyl ester carboxylesterase
MKNPILLLHGALGSSEQLIAFQEILSSEREVFTMDFEGHGNSKSSRDFSIELFTQNVLDFLKEKKISKVDIFGYSMGGYVALYLASKFPEIIGRIITLGTKFDWNPEFAEKEIKMLNPSQIQEKVPAFAERLQQLHGTKNWKNVVLKTAEMMQDLGKNPVLNEKSLQQIENKTLICLGGLDKMATVEDSQTVANWLPNGEFKLIENFKHPIETVPAEELATIINNFLKEYS